MFKKKRKQEQKGPQETPKLPELPKLPEFPGQEDFSQIHQLPRYPNNSTGDRFSQNTIKEAVTGKKEDVGENANDFESFDEIKTMQPPQKRAMEIDEERTSFQEMPKPTPPIENPTVKIPEIPNLEENPSQSIMPSKPMKEEIEMSKPLRKNLATEKGPDQIFVRLDKFEESQELIEEIRKQVSGIGKLLKKTKEIKEDEDQELKEWETELQEIKTNIEKIDKDLFSKL